jgi:DNA-binding NtrC family response regulator
MSHAPPGSSPPLRVLVVDADPRVRRALARALLARAVDVLTAEDAQAALALLAASRVDAVLVDHALSSAFIRSPTRAPVVVMAALGVASDIEHDVFAVIGKPVSPEALLIVERAGEHRRLRAKLAEAELDRSDGGKLLGASPCMRQLRRVVRSAGRTSAPVLVVGERGAGKSQIARSIHASSARKGGPFVSVDAGALPPEILMSELFGAAAGEGFVASARGGTLHVEDLGRLPELAQKKLLHLLVHHEVLREGAAEPADVRVVAECSEEAKTLVSRGELREDLAARIAVFIVRVPPLRQRPDDIALLAYHFAHEHSARTGREFTRIGVEALRWLRAHPWPGNVRELDAAMEHAVALAHGGAILPADLVGAPESSPSADLGALSTELAESPYALAKDRLISAFDAFYVRELMRLAAGNVSEAARRAKMDRSNFRRLLKKSRDPAK